jgi:hypothetical protein
VGYHPVRQDFSIFQIDGLARNGLVLSPNNNSRAARMRERQRVVMPATSKGKLAPGDPCSLKTFLELVKLNQKQISKVEEEQAKISHRSRV